MVVNLLAVSGLAGLQLYGAARAIKTDHIQPQIATIDFHGASNGQPMNGGLAASGRYPLHPVRIVTRSLDQAAPGLPLLAALDSSDQVQTGPTLAIPDGATSRTSPPGTDSRISSLC